VLAFYAATVSGYGVFRDELYYIACGRHLAWGYVDHPPLVAAIAAAVRVVGDSTGLIAGDSARLIAGDSAGLIAGDSWIALRLAAAIAAAITTLVVGETARTLGAGRWARLLAQLLAAVAPVYLSLFSIYSMNVLDVCIWAMLAWIAARILGGGDPRLWLAFGALAGIGLENKFDVALLGAGLAVGLVLSGRVDVLRSRYPWFGGGIALLIFLPHLVWQWHNDWPTREFVGAAQRHKITPLGALGFLRSQFSTAGPIGFALALAGLAWLLFAREARSFRALGWAALAVLGVLAFSISKPYYFSPALTLLFPAAARALEGWTEGRFRRPLRIATVVAVASTAALAPLAKPLLSEDRYLRYAAALRVAPRTDENHRVGRLPQFFADMHGWREMAQAVADVHGQLPPQDRARACVYAQNYGEAGAIDYFGPALGLPAAMSGHNNYWLWGPGACTGEVVLIVGGDRVDHLENFERVDPGGTFHCDDCMPYESDLTIWVARRLKVPIAQAWSGSRHYD